MNLSKKVVLTMIDQAEWLVDDTGTLNLYVSDLENRPVHCWLTERNYYCDRGHIQLMVDGHLDIDEADSFPRYFFSFEEADKHVRTFLKWRIASYRVESGKLPFECFAKIDNPIAKARG